MFSPVQARLSLFLLALNELSPHATVKSFHHANSSLIRNNLEAQLEWMDKNNMLKNLINNETSLEQLKEKVKEMDNGASLNSNFNRRNWDIFKNIKDQNTKNDPNKKGIHTKANNIEPISLKNNNAEKANNITPLQYFDVIPEVLKEHKNDPVSAQRQIENNWAKIVRLKMEKASAQLVRSDTKSILLKAQETLELQLEDKFFY